MPSPPDDAAGWLDTLSPWPAEFGLGRMRALLADVGDPQLAYPAVHVVGTNGKSTATLTVEALLRAEGLSVGATISPHIRSWSERIRVDGAEVDFDTALAGVRPAVEVRRATQFEAVTGAAFATFAARGVDAAVVEAGLGGRLDATNVLRSRVVLLTNVSLEHTEVLGDTREAIAAEKLAVVRDDAVAVLPDDEFSHLLPAGATHLLGGPREAAEAFLGHPVAQTVEVRLPGRLERRGDDVWDGAHNPAGVSWLVERLPPGERVVLASILADKDVDAMLATLSRAGRRFVATRSSNPRALDAGELGRRAAAHFAEVVVEPDPRVALRRARELGPVLATGSLYLVGDLAQAEA